MNTKFSDGSASSYEELPVPVAWLSWTRGNAQLRAVEKSDPGAFLGGWHAMVLDKDKNKLPALPLPIVERTSMDGKFVYQVYASNFVTFLPIAHRTRFEYRERVKDAQTGREYDRVVSVSKERRQGYVPYRQVFGLIFHPKEDTYAPAVLKVWKWSTFITFERAGQAWNKIEKLGIPEGKALLRRYGTLGKKDGDVTTPNFEIYGQGRSTPIEAVGTGKPRLIDLLPAFDQLWEASQAWKECARWNAEGKVPEEDTASDKSLFLAKCDEMGLSNIEIEQLTKEFGKDYKKALASLSYGEEDINDKLAENDQQYEEPPF